MHRKTDSQTADKRPGPEPRPEPGSGPTGNKRNAINGLLTYSASTLFRVQVGHGRYGVYPRTNGRGNSVVSFSDTVTAPVQIPVGDEYPTMPRTQIAAVTKRASGGKSISR